MPRVLIVPFVVALGLLAVTPLAGCAAELGPGPAGPATALTLPARSTTPEADDDTDDDTADDRSDTSSRAPAPPADGDDVRACFDGDCEVRVPDGTTITVDPRFGVEGILVTVADGRARIRIDTGSGFVSSGGTGSSSTYNDLTVRLLGVEGDAAVVRLTS